MDLPSALTSACDIRRPTHKNDPMITRNGNQDTIKLTNQGTSSCISVSTLTVRLSSYPDQIRSMRRRFRCFPPSHSATGQKTFNHVVHSFELVPMLVDGLADWRAVAAGKRACNLPRHPDN